MDLQRLFFLRPDDKLSLKELLSLLYPTQEIEHKLLNLHLVGVLTGNASQLFKDVEGHLYPKEGISLRNETEGCSKSVLGFYSQLGDRISFLLNSINKCLVNEDDHVLTRISYSLTLRDIIDECIVKKLLHVHEITMRVNYFSDYLENETSDYLLIKLNSLHEIGSALNSGRDCAGKILNILMDFIYLDRVHQFNLVSQLLLASLRPSLDYIESLLTNGVIKDDRSEFFISIKTNLDPDHFWSNCLMCDSANSLPNIFTSSWEYITTGVKSRLLINILEKDSSNIKINYPRGCLFDHFLSHLRAIYKNKSTYEKINNNKNNEAKTKCDLKLRLEKYQEILPLNYEYLNIDDQLESGAKNHNFTSLEDYSLEPFLPDNYALDGIPLELALQKALTNTLKAFIFPISEWLIDHSKSSYHINLITFNDYFLLQRSNPEMRLYFEALFTDITEGTCKPETYLNWRYYTFSEANVRAFLSDQRLNGKRSVNNLTILENIHLIYEEMDWTSRVIIDNKSKLIYDQAFQFLLHLTYCRWILDNLRLPRNNIGRHSCYSHQLYLIRHRLQLIANNLYNYIMNNIHQEVFHLYQSFQEASDYSNLKDSFIKFIKRIEIITMQRTDNSNSKVVRTLVRKFVQLVNEIRLIWLTKEDECKQLPVRSEIDNFEKGFKIYLYNVNDDVLIKN